MTEKRTDQPNPDDDIYGGPSLLDRLGRGKAVAAADEQPQSTQALKHSSAKTLKTQDALESTTVAPEDGQKNQNVRVSVYLTPDDLDALDEQVIKNRRAAGRKRDRSELIREAVRFWLTSQHQSA